MLDSKKYLQRNFIISNNDTVITDLPALMEYTKLLQLETLKEYLMDNYPEEVGMINTFQYEIESILRNEKIENQEDSNPLQY